MLDDCGGLHNIRINLYNYNYIWLYKGTTESRMSVWSAIGTTVGYPALGQTPYVALVVPAYGEICNMMFRSHVA